MEAFTPSSLFPDTLDKYADSVVTPSQPQRVKDWLWRGGGEEACSLLAELEGDIPGGENEGTGCNSVSLSGAQLQRAQEHEAPEVFPTPSHSQQAEE